MAFRFNACRCAKAGGTVVIDANDMASALESLALQAKAAKKTIDPDYILGVVSSIREDWIKNFGD